MTDYTEKLTTLIHQQNQYWISKLIRLIQMNKTLTFTPSQKRSKPKFREWSNNISAEVLEVTYKMPDAKLYESPVLSKCPPLSKLKLMPTFQFGPYQLTAISEIS